MDLGNNFLSLIVILLVLFIGGAIVVIGGESVSTTVYTTLFNSTANTSNNLGHSINSVNYLNRLTTNSSTNATPILTTPANHTLLLTSPSSISSNIVVVHAPGISSMGIGVYVNSNFVGNLTDNATDTFTYSGSLSTTTVVSYQ